MIKTLLVATLVLLNVEQIERNNRVGFMKSCIVAGGEYNYAEDDCNLTRS